MSQASSIDNQDLAGLPETSTVPDKQSEQSLTPATLKRSVVFIHPAETTPSEFGKSPHNENVAAIAVS